MTDPESPGGRRSLTALVPMKGHSERIPDKNIKELGGKPLCCWILETLRSTAAVDRIVVNTDSREIAEIAADEFDVEVHPRPEELRGDFVSMNRIIEYDLQRLQSGDHFLQTHATNPFLRAETLEDAVSRYFSGTPEEHDSVFSVTRHQSRFYDSDGRPVNHDPSELLRTQDLPPLFEENSNFYLFSRESFRAAGNRIGERAARFTVDPREALDIDEPWEWRLAEALVSAGLM